MKLKDKRVLIIGAGESGQSAEKFLQSRGAKTLVFDDRFEMDIERLCAEDFDLAVLSPGVSINHQLAQKFKHKLLSELSLGFARCRSLVRFISALKAPIVAVTGTNGKTSVVNLLHQAIGPKKSFLCGNCGPPATAITSKDMRRKIAITEVSSFMTEPEVAKEEPSRVRKGNRCKFLPRPFRPDIAVILNITQDHLDRHGTVDNYIRHKLALTAHQRRSDILILNYDCPNTRELEKNFKKEKWEKPARSGPKILWFSTTARVRGIYVEDGIIWLNLRHKRRALFTLGELGLYRQHDIENFLATALVSRYLRVRLVNLLNLRSIENHRIEFVATIGQTSFYNDSKGTNISATLAAVNSFSLPVNLILGGQRKGQDFAKLFEVLPAQVNEVFVFGEDAHHILSSAVDAGWGSRISVYDGMESAVKAAYAGPLGKKNDGPNVVLLSPACASFGEFRNYAHRGEQFIEIVKTLAEYT